MLKRVYIHNFRAFQNFECRLDPLVLLMGANGTGKTSLFEVLEHVQRFCAAGLSADAVFFPNSLNRWAGGDEQQFEFDLELEGLHYRFRLRVALPKPPHKPRVVEESVSCDGQPVFGFVDGEVRLYNDHHELKVSYPFDWTRSALSTMVPRPDNLKLARFRNWLSLLTIVRVEPARMVGRAERDDIFPLGNLANFASWYRHLSQEHLGEIGDLQHDLRAVLPGFVALEPKNAGGNTRFLMATFETPAGPRQFDFGELSDGQRALIALYCLRRFSLRRGSTLCIDEPDNFVALREIQPWLNGVIDKADDGDGQALIISHHPELLNQLAANHGVVFRREGHGPVRAERFRADGADVLTPAELVARGWDE